eukprot:TRINITY_DN20402_c0_g1_i1.p1 TRINITY_DN20402_c0_g1~~TRINITY_DN20402_c0_g1_i1.p1  ORF type:complete len:165 (+),score=22.77 TRINITY_DN20402_c0_g1_i1:328-822(+)
MCTRHVAVPWSWHEVPLHQLLECTAECLQFWMEFQLHSVHVLIIFGARICSGAPTDDVRILANQGEAVTLECWRRRLQVHRKPLQILGVKGTEVSQTPASITTSINNDEPINDYCTMAVSAHKLSLGCLLYTSDAADEEDSVELVGMPNFKKKKDKSKHKYTYL